MFTGEDEGRSPTHLHEKEKNYLKLSSQRLITNLFTLLFVGKTKTGLQQTAGPIIYLHTVVAPSRLRGN